MIKRARHVLFMIVVGIGVVSLVICGVIAGIAALWGLVLAFGALCFALSSLWEFLSWV